MPNASEQQQLRQALVALFAAGMSCGISAVLRPLREPP